MGEVVALISDERRKKCERALRDVAIWAKKVEVAREAYGDAIDACDRLGLSPTVIGRHVGKSEAAIRMYLKRRKKK